MWLDTGATWVFLEVNTIETVKQAHLQKPSQIRDVASFYSSVICATVLWQIHGRSQTSRLLPKSRASHQEPLWPIREDQKPEADCTASGLPQQFPW